MTTAEPFTPAWFLRNPHLMTMVPRYWPRGPILAGIPQTERLFTTDPGTQLLGLCHWQERPTEAPTLLLVHGLEGCADSHYMRGIAAKAYRVGFNVIRMNQRNCGGTERLTPTLYNSGLSQDYRAILKELRIVDRLTDIWLIGYSMGGNLILKAAGELGSDEPALAGAVAVCPNIDPTQCVVALEESRNWIYHRHFLTKLKARLRRKAALFPGKWDLRLMSSMSRISQFDDVYTARDGGYRDGADYYDRAGARHVLPRIAVPTLIMTAQDDPFIPYSMFLAPAIQSNPAIQVLAPRHGGHCGFFQETGHARDRYWAEHRILEFVQETRKRMQAR